MLRIRDSISVNVLQKPNRTLLSFNTNSMNYAIADRKTGSVLMEFVYQNTFAVMNDFAEKMRESNTKPEFEIFDPGGFYNVLLINKNEGVFKTPLFQNPVPSQGLRGKKIVLTNPALLNGLTVEISEP